MIQPNLPVAKVKNGSFATTKVIEYNKEREFHWDYNSEEILKETWLPNSISLNKRIAVGIDYGDREIYTTKMKVELKDDGLYVSGKNIPHIEDGEYHIGYDFRVEEEMWCTELYERKISKGTIYGVFLIVTKKGRQE